MAEKPELTIGWDPQPITAELLYAYTPEKLEMIEGQIPGGRELFRLLLRQLGGVEALRILADELTAK